MKLFPTHILADTSTEKVYAIWTAALRLSLPLFYQFIIYGILKDTKKEKLYYQRFVNSVDLLDNGVTEVIKRSYKEAQNRLQAIKEEEFFKYGVPK